MGVEIESIKDKEDDQSNLKVEEKEVDICSEVENAEDEITTKGDQIAEVHKKEKEIEKVGREIVKDRKDDQSSPKVEENKDDICSDVENVEDKIINEGYQIAEVNKKEKEIEKKEIGRIKEKEDE